MINFTKCWSANICSSNIITIQNRTFDVSCWGSLSYRGLYLQWRNKEIQWKNVQMSIHQKRDKLMIQPNGTEIYFCIDFGNQACLTVAVLYYFGQNHVSHSNWVELMNIRAMITWAVWVTSARPLATRLDTPVRPVQIVASAGWSEAIPRVAPKSQWRKADISWRSALGLPLWSFGWTGVGRKGEHP